MLRPSVRIRRIEALLLALLITGLCFIGGSAIVDWLFIREPSSYQVTAGVRETLPVAYKHFDLQQVSSDSFRKSNVTAAARAVLSPRQPLFKLVDFQEVAIQRGDDPAGFVDAVARRQKFDPKTAPPLPNVTPLGTLYAVVPQSESQFTVDVSYRAQKDERKWPLNECWRIWSGYRNWNFSDVVWPELPPSVSALRDRRELGLNAAILGEQPTENWFKDYVSRRKAFIKAVLERENRSTEQLIDDSVREALARQLKPLGVYEFRSVTAVRSKAASGEENTPSEAKVVIQQSADLFRSGDKEEVRAQLSALIDSLESAKKLAEEFLQDRGLAVPVMSAVYDIASPEGATLTGTVRFEIKRSTTGSITVENIRWLQEPQWPTGVVFRRQEAEPDSVFRSGDSKLRNVARFQEEIERYIKSVTEGIASLESQWGNDREIWRMVLRAFAAQGGRDHIRRHASFVEEVSGVRVGGESKQYAFKGARRTLLPFRFREDFSFSGEKVVGNQTETLNEHGFWRNADGAMSHVDLTSPAHVLIQRRMAFAKNILWHLAAEIPPGQKVVRGIEPHSLRVSSSTPELPEVTIKLDPDKGWITSARYDEPTSKEHKLFEVRFSEFTELQGGVRPKKMDILMDGELKEALTVLSWAPSTEVKPESFRNPYSPGKPFRGNAKAPNHAVAITNATAFGTPILICFDDNTDTVALGSKSERTILLQEGDHEMTIVAWIPQLSLKQSHRVESRAGRISLRRPIQLTVNIDRNANPPISWSTR